ncbi:MAG: response regulator [Oligoflexia bacterium]|nr:response regulator [Oligoflexia bacterium]
MKKILVLDDDQDIHQLFKLDFNDSDYVMDYAESVEQALKKLNEEVYFCAFIDIFMSDNKTSEEVIEFLKNEESGLNRYLPIILMSSRICKEKATALTLKGPNVFTAITKPFTKGQLLRTISGPHENSVLLIDDDPDMHAYFKSLLLKENYQVYSTMTAHHGIAFLENMDFDGTFIDQQLNDVATGKEIIEYINEHYKDKMHKFKLISSSKDIHETNIEGIETLQKPLMPKQILGALEISKEEVRVFQGTDEINEESQVISGAIEEDESVQVVKGSKEEEDNFKMTISSDLDENLDEEVIKVKGGHGKDSSDQDHKVTIKGGGFESEEDNFMQVKSLKQSPEEQIKTLLNQDDINGRNQQGLTPLMVFSYMGKEELIEDALLKGADLKLKSKGGKTPLHFASRSGNLACVEKLILHGAKVNARDNNQCEPIYDAIITKNTSIVEYLLENGARPNSKIDGKSYLFYALKVNSPELVKILCESGLDPRKNELGGDSPLVMAQKRGMKECFKVLSEYAK